MLQLQKRFEGVLLGCKKSWLRSVDTTATNAKWVVEAIEAWKQSQGFF